MTLVSKLIVLAMATALTSVHSAEPKVVGNKAELLNALKTVNPGDVIEVNPGTYKVMNSLEIRKSGTKEKPITLRAQGAKGYPVILTRMVQMHAAYWVIEGIHFKGLGQKSPAIMKLNGETNCHDVVIRNCKMSDAKFYAVKSSRTPQKGPSNITIEGCEAYNTGSTCLDLVSGDNWVVRNNYVHDYATNGRICYGIFVKGGSKNGLIEANLVDAMKRKTTVGISFGGGRTGRVHLPSGAGDEEHINGICRNNIVVNTTDVAYHSNYTQGCVYYNNLAFNCGGGLQNQPSPCKPIPVSINNVIVKHHGKVNAKNHFARAKEAWFVDPAKYDFRLTPAGEAAMLKGAIKVEGNETDIFGNKRGDIVSAGPILPGASQTRAWTDPRK